MVRFDRAERTPTFIAPSLAALGGAFVVSILIGCTSDPVSMSEPIACVGGQFCPEGLTCVNGLCVPGSSTDPTVAGESSDSSSMGMTTMDTTTDDPTTDGPETGSDTVETGSDTTETNDTVETNETVDPEMDFPVGEDCDMFAQDCPPNQKCVPYDSDGQPGWDDQAHCVALTGNQGFHESCAYTNEADGIENCGPNLLCWHDLSGQDGVCIEMCGGTEVNPECSDEAQCFSFGMMDDFHLCLDHCNPYTQDFCPNQKSCYWNGDLSLFYCYNEGDLPSGSACRYINDCAPGHMCIDASFLPDCDMGGCCAAFCDLANPNCPAGTSCEPYWQNAPMGQEDLGVCVTP